MDNNLSISLPSKEGILRCSKWVSYTFLISLNELQYLFDILSNFYLINTFEPCPLEKAVLPHAAFLEIYNKYIKLLANGDIPDPSLYKKAFYHSISSSLENLYAMEVSKGYLIKPKKPLIFLRPAAITYSELDQKLRSTLPSQKTILWGLEASYPQIYENSLTRETKTIINDFNYPNSSLFHILRKTLRKLSEPFQLQLPDKKIMTPFRIGKEVKNWIHHHPQLSLLKNQLS